MILRLRLHELLIACGLALALLVGLGRILVAGAERSKAVVADQHEWEEKVSSLSTLEMAQQWATKRAEEGPLEPVVTEPETIEMVSEEEFRKLQLANRMDINMIGAVELQRIPGVGPSRAKDIIAYRERVGKIKNVRELTQVSGISASMLETLEEHVQVVSETARP